MELKIQANNNKQASDDEDNEIEIVEPKTDLITLDSDDEEPVATYTTPVKSNANTSNPLDVKVKPAIPSASIASRCDIGNASPTIVPAVGRSEESMDLMSMAQSFLASMLEVDIQEGPLNSPGSDSSGQKKQPRKKLTNKPNPTLLKQKALMERERLEEIKRNDQKLKMKCSVELKKAEEEYPYAKEMLEARAKEKQEEENVMRKNSEEEETEGKVKLVVETDKETVEVEVLIGNNDIINSSTEEKNNTTQTKSPTINYLNKTKKIIENLTETNEDKIKEKERNEKDAITNVTNKIEVEVEESSEIKNDGEVINIDHSEDRYTEIGQDVSTGEEKSVCQINAMEFEGDTKDHEFAVDPSDVNEKNVYETSEIIENEFKMDESKTANGTYENNKELLEITDMDEKAVNEESVEIYDKESVEKADYSITSNSEKELDVDEEIEKVLQQRGNNTSDNECVNHNDNCGASEVIINEILPDLPYKEQTTMNTTAVVSEPTTTNNGSV